MTTATWLSCAPRIISRASTQGGCAAAARPMGRSGGPPVLTAVEDVLLTDPRATMTGAP